jgi:hypothetical protein
LLHEQIGERVGDGGAAVDAGEDRDARRERRHRDAAYGWPCRLLSQRPQGSLQTVRREQLESVGYIQQGHLQWNVRRNPIRLPQ